MMKKCQLDMRWGYEQKLYLIHSKNLLKILLEVKKISDFINNIGLNSVIINEIVSKPEFLSCNAAEAEGWKLISSICRRSGKFS